MTADERAWVGTGVNIRVDAPQRPLPEFDPRTGDHLWNVIAMFRIDVDRLGDPDHTPMLDGENLVSIMGPGCLHCEETYTPRLAKRRCRGKGRS